ncbi:hypothetical protein KIPB_013289, partial [Kipferlia bialata]
AHRESATAAIRELTERLEIAETALSSLADKRSREMATLTRERETEREAHCEETTDLRKRRVVLKGGEREMESATDKESLSSWIDPSFGYVSPALNTAALPCSECASAALTITQLEGRVVELQFECNSLKQRER